MIALMWVLACAGKPAETGAPSSEETAPPTVDDPDGLVPIALSSSAEGTQPMTGLVLWTDAWNGHPAKDVVQLEYAYVAPADLVVGEGAYDWTALDDLLDGVASRGHQAIVRFYYVYPGRQTAVPGWIKALPDYHETEGVTEGLPTWFPDWSHASLQSAHVDFYTAFADRYDADPRLAYLQVGFGLWGEYHIYDGPAILGQTFPSKDFQRTFLAHLDDVLHELTFSVSIDAGDDALSGIPGDAATEALAFGLFDDSFMHEHHDQYNAAMFARLGADARSAASPIGGELSYYSGYDQEHALDPAGMYGRTFEELADQFHVTYMIGNDQPAYQTVARLEEASAALGYALEVTRFDASATRSEVDVVNRGMAPVLFDAWVTVDGVRAEASLRGLAPGQSRSFDVATGGASPSLAITSDRLVPGQVIGFDATLEGR